MIISAEEYMSTKVRARVKRIELESKNNVQWDFRSGDHSYLIKGA